MNRPNKSPLTLETLDERTLPAVTLLNVSAQGAVVSGSGFIARQIDAAPANQFDTFLRIRGDFGDTEQGYNTTSRRQPFDTVTSSSVHPALTLSQVPVVTVNGVNYREFILDASQRGFQRLSVDEVQIFLGSTSNLSNYRGNGTLSGLHPVFDLDAQRDTALVLNAGRNAGAGFGDISLLIADSRFAGASPDTFVYLYSKLGGKVGGASGGAESWAVRLPEVPPSPPPAPPPPPPVGSGTSSISGQVWVDSNQDGVVDSIETLLPHVTIHLTGTDDLGNQVDLTTTTNASGLYSFNNLRAGIYTLTEDQPSAAPSGQFVSDGLDWLGTLGGDLDNDIITNINVGANQQGTGYNFTEIFPE